MKTCFCSAVSAGSSGKLTEIEWTDGEKDIYGQESGAYSQLWTRNKLYLEET